MNKGLQFWVDSWHEGRIPFHKELVNPDLKRYWPGLNLSPKARVLVPLCGKSVDMFWLASQGFEVIGIELSELAILQFAEENKITLTKKVYEDAIHYFSPQFSLWVGDIFSLNLERMSPVDAIYDRAALIALPEKIRPSYVEICLKLLKKNGKILLKTMYYDESELQGPPFSVPDSEVKVLYKDREIVNCLHENGLKVDKKEHLFQRGLRHREDYVWQIY
ncbi:MAG: thiopurine S-methyltransferase [Tatlockia sp.]|nr:thiopurine S-methyltransferase [Tatlockia sp.]